MKSSVTHTSEQRAYVAPKPDTLLSNAMDTDPTIRPATPLDVPRLLEMLGDVDEQHRGALPWLLTDDGATLMSDLEPFLSSPDRIALVVHAPDDDAIAGLVLVFVRELSDTHIVRASLVAEIDTIVVHHRFRRCGLGTKLVHAAVAWAHDAGATRVELGVYDFNREAVAFWASLGFEPLSFRLVQHLR